MIITCNSQTVLEINDDLVSSVLDIYPEEKLQERKRFKEAFQLGSMKFDVLSEECETLQVPWQLFFLDEANLKLVLLNMKNVRNAKFDFKEVANRSGAGTMISTRVLDRLIKLQNYTIGDLHLKNDYCASLKAFNIIDAAEHMRNFFGISYDQFMPLSKERALEHLVQIVERRQISVSRGVLSNKVLPMAPELKQLYKQSSGFVVKSEILPYIFLPSEINHEETAGRQIYTLLLLLALIGLDEYNTAVQSDYQINTSRPISTDKAHRIVSEILLPHKVTDKLVGGAIDEQIRDDLSAKYKMTPTAVVVTLYQRGVISSKEIYSRLIESIPINPKKDSFAKTPLVRTSTAKFCGVITSTKIINDLSSGRLSSAQAQYLLFGHIDKKKFQEYRLQNKI